MQNSSDLSSLIGKIMENPALIEEISALLGSSEKSEDPKPKKTEEKEAVKASLPLTPPKEINSSGRERRNRLLYAMKPYLSEGRAKAIDTMITLADTIRVVKGG